MLKDWILLQTSASLQAKLRRGNFRMLERPPRMLPRMFNPVRLDVDCSAKTPMKEPQAKKGRKPRAGKTSGKACRSGRGARPNSADNEAFAAGKSCMLMSRVWCI